MAKGVLAKEKKTRSVAAELGCTSKTFLMSDVGIQIFHCCHILVQFSTHQEMYGIQLILRKTTHYSHSSLLIWKLFQNIVDSPSSTS